LYLSMLAKSYVENPETAARFYIPPIAQAINALAQEGKFEPIELRATFLVIFDKLIAQAETDPARLKIVSNLMSELRKSDFHSYAHDIPPPPIPAKPSRIRASLDQAFG